MKHRFLQYICLGLFFAGSLSFLGALEIEFAGGVNNLTFHPQSELEYGEGNRRLQAYPYGLLNLIIRGDLSGILSYDISIERDNILQNSITGALITRTDNFRFEFGLFMGISDKFDTPDMGFTGNIEFTLPGIGYLSLSGSSTLGDYMAFTSNNRRETAEIKLGYWLLDNFILTLSAETKSFTRHYGTPNLTAIRDQLTRYQFSIEYYDKNSPYTVRLDTGYETLSRAYTRGNRIPAKDELNALFAGVELNWQITHPIRIKAGIEIPINITPVAPLTVAPGLGFFKAYAGITYSFF